MADIFVSYARQDRRLVVPIVAALQAQGWSVWWDPEIAPGQEFDRLIADELDAARAVVVVWTPASTASRWVKGEARDAADRGILAPVRFDGARLPIDVRSIHTTDFDGWSGDPKSPPFRELCRAIAGLLDETEPTRPADAPPSSPAARASATICVLPFANMSNDPEQDYFADGITEDIITDLGNVSALLVTSRNTAFGLKGKTFDLQQLARQLQVGHVLQGSVRKSGDRIRITAQLINAATDTQVWAARFDRDIRDIFAVQDEISESIVAALKINLMPGEREALEQRDTTNPEAYKLYLMARQYSFTGNSGSCRQSEAIVRLCRAATRIDPDYARAWALSANAEAALRYLGGKTEDGGRTAAQTALALDPDLAEAHAAMGRVLIQEERYDEALAEVERALALDPESYEVNIAAARWYFCKRRMEESIACYAKAAALAEADYLSAGMMMVGYQVLGEAGKSVEAALMTRERTEKVIAVEPDNGSAMGYLVTSLIILGEVDSAKAWMQRALLLDPDNMKMRYNFCCDLVLLEEHEAALDMLAPIVQSMTREHLNWMNADPDLDPIRETARFRAILAEAEAVVAGTR